MRLFVLTNPVESGKSSNIFQDDGNPFQKGIVPFNDENEKVIKQYLQSKNFPTCLRWVIATVRTIICVNLTARRSPN